MIGLAFLFVPPRGIVWDPAGKARVRTPGVVLGSGLINPEEEDASESDGGLEDVGTSVLSRVDAAPVLEASEEIFDFVALPIEVFVVAILDFVAAMRRDAGGDASLGEGFAEPA